MGKRLATALMTVGIIFILVGAMGFVDTMYFACT